MPSSPSSPRPSSASLISSSAASRSPSSSPDSPCSTRTSASPSAPPGSSSVSSSLSPSLSCSSPSSSAPSGSRSGSKSPSTNSRSLSSFEASAAKAAWSSMARPSASRSPPAFSSIQPETRSSPARALSGGVSPVSRSRTSRPTAVSSGTSTLVRARVIGSVRIRISVARARFERTPAIERAPSASTRACSAASNTARAISSAGTLRAWSAGLWWRSLSAAASAKPRASATSRSGRVRPGIGTFTALPEADGLSAVKPNSSSGSRAIARAAPVSTWRKASSGLSSAAMSGLRRDALRKVLAEDALIIFGHQRPLRLVALVQEGEAEGKADVAEDQGVLRPADHRARAHHGRDVAVHEALAGQIGDLDHPVDLLPAALMVVLARFGEDDPRLGRGRQIVERHDNVPAVHLALIDLLGAVIEAGRVAEADRVGGREQAEIGVGADHPILVEQGQLALGLEHALDDEHHVRAAGVIFVEHQSSRGLQRPGQQALRSEERRVGKEG